MSRLLFFMCKLCFVPFEIKLGYHCKWAKVDHYFWLPTTHPKHNVPYCSEKLLCNHDYKSASKGLDFSPITYYKQPSIFRSNRKLRLHCYVTTRRPGEIGSTVIVVRRSLQAPGMRPMSLRNTVKTACLDAQRGKKFRASCELDSNTMICVQECSSLGVEPRERVMDYGCVVWQCKKVRGPTL